MQQIKIANPDKLQAPPDGQPSLPGEMNNQQNNASGGAGNSPTMKIPGAVSEGDIFKAVEGSKFNTLMTEGNPTLGQGATGNNAVPIGGMIDGGLATELMDALLPSLLVALMAALGAEMKKTDLQLTAKEKSTIAPLMQRCLDQLMVNFQSPFAALGVTLVVIYGAKVTEKGIVQIIDKKAARAAARKSEQSQPVQTVKKDSPVISSEQPAPVITMKPPEQKIVRRAATSTNWMPTEEQIFEGIRRVKYNRQDTIARLQREHAAGTLDAFFKRKPIKK